MTNPDTSMPKIPPLSFWQACLLFGIPALLAVAKYYYVIPMLMRSGLSQQIAFFITHLVFFLLMILAAVTGYRLEKRTHGWSDFKERMRLRRMTGVDWNWMTGAIFAFAALYFGGLALTNMLLDSIGWAPPVFGLKIAGSSQNWILFFVLLIFNILGEELWWRGYILPRQETIHGETTWAIHGVLWAFFHIYKWWEVPAMVLPAMVIPFMAQRRQNTTPGIFMHYALNGVNALLILT